MARRHGRARGQALQVLDHVPDRALRADDPGRFHLPATLTDHRSHQATIDDLWDFDDPEASEHRFALAADAADGVERDVLLTQVARALGLQGRFNEASALLASLPAGDHELAVRVLLENGRVINSGGEADLARPLFHSAFTSATEAGLEFLAIDALHMLAIVAPADEQDDLNGRALELASSADDPRARQWRGSLLNNMGWTAFDRGDLDGALALFEDALAARLEQGKQSETVVARWCVARCLREMGRVDDALAIQLALADELYAAGKTDNFVDEEIALLQAKTTPEPGTG